MVISSVVILHLWAPLNFHVYFRYFLADYVKSGVGDFHIMPLKSYELCENWLSENHTLSTYL